jgi:hypothetical protein
MRLNISNYPLLFIFIKSLTILKLLFDKRKTPIHNISLVL